MGTFEYITALIAVVIGLAIADLATSLHRLLRSRSAVRWNWVSPVAALVILTELFNLWWQWRGFTGSTMGDVAPYFASLILLFLAASVTLPDVVPEDGIDLGRYFDDNRKYFWVVYGSYVALFVTLMTLRDIQDGLPTLEILQRRYFDYPSIVVCFLLVFIKTRWISGAFLVVTLLWLLWGFDWWNRPLMIAP